MRETSPSLRPPGRMPALALALVPAAVITAIMAVVMAVVLAVAPALGPAGVQALYDSAVLANIAVWFAFSPPYLVGWVQLWDPALRGRTGVLGVVALAGVLWFVNLFAYACTGSLLGAVLRG